MEFSLSRFWLLTRKQWVENRKPYVLGAMALIGILSFFILFTILSDNHTGFHVSSQETVFFVGLISAGAIFSSTLLKPYEEKPKSIQAFMIPASIVEKFLVAILYSMIFFPVVYLVIAYPLIMLGLYIDVEVLGHLNLPFALKHERLLRSPLLCLIIQSCFLLFSVVFRRYAFLKTMVMVSVLLVSCFSFNDYMAKTMLGDAQPSVLPKGNYDRAIMFPENKGPHWFSFAGSSLYSGLTINSSGGNNQWEVKLPESEDTVFDLYVISIAPLLWLITFLKLREKQL